MTLGSGGIKIEGPVGRVPVENQNSIHDRVCVETIRGK